MHAAYLSYYAILAALAARPVAVRPARAPRARRCFAMMAAFYLCYTAFLLFPVAGPRYLLPAAENAATAVPAARLTHRLLERGSAWGTAFPSSHVAVALVAAVCAWRALAAPSGPCCCRSRCCSRSRRSTASSTTASTPSPGLAVAGPVLWWHAAATAV